MKYLLIILAVALLFCASAYIATAQAATEADYQAIADLIGIK